MELGTEIKGVFLFNGLIFEAGYRSAFPLYHQGGYDKCLKIYNGPNNLSPTDYLVDDKFKVVSVENLTDSLLIRLDFGIYEKDKLQEALNNNTLLKTVVLYKESSSLDSILNRRATSESKNAKTQAKKLSDEEKLDRLAKIFMEIIRISGVEPRVSESGEDNDEYGYW